MTIDILYVKHPITRPVQEGRVILAHVVDYIGGEGDGTFGLFEPWPVRAAYFASGMYPMISETSKKLLNRTEGSTSNGEVLFFRIFEDDDRIEVANLSAFGYSGCVKDDSVHSGFRHLPPKVDLHNLRRCLNKVFARAQAREEKWNFESGHEGDLRYRYPKPYQTARAEASVHMTRLGCGLGGATWTEVLPIVEETLSDKGIRVFVYDPE